jgi:uridine phosphorylase
MTRFGKPFLLKCLKVASALVSVFLPSMAMAVSVGLYAGTFDPPSPAQLEILRCVLADASLPSACQEIGQRISRLVVLVNEDNEADPLASTRERVLMVKKELEKYGNRVEVMTATEAQREEKKRALLVDKNLKQLVQFVGDDSDKVLQSAPATHDPRLTSLVLTLVPSAKRSSNMEQPRNRSSVAVKDAFQADAVMAPLVDSSANEVIDKLGLYQEVSEDLAPLQKALFEEGWRDFLRDLELACPVTLDRGECSALASRWQAISVVTHDSLAEKTGLGGLSAKSQLVYKKAQSEDRWAEKFSTTALRYLEGSQSYDKLKPVADDIGTRVFQGYPYGKLPHLRRASMKQAASSIRTLRVTPQPVACAAPQGSYNADIDQYLADRFPRAFSAFLKGRGHRSSTLPVELYVHNHAIEQAYAVHRRSGYTDFYFLQTRRGQFHRNIYLARKSNPLAYRVVLTSVRGNDRRANVFCQIHRTEIFSNYYFVQSAQAQPLFVLNPQGTQLRLDREDLLLFGFKGDWSRKLLARDWRKTPLVKEGLDIDLFTHPAIRQKIVVARNVYGDDADIILNTFYQKGMRRVVYLGSAGAIADYAIGDVVIPNEFVDRHHRSVPFQNNLARAYQSEISDLVPVHGDIKQGWVQSLFDETKAVLLDWRTKSVGSVDIEGIYLGRFAARHRDLQIAALFVISDQTLGDITIEDTNAHRGIIDESVDKLVSFLLPRLLGAN